MAKKEGKSDLSRAFSEDGKLKTHVGGQALLEGIMMRGRYNWSAAVRLPNGEIYTEEHDLASGKEKNKWMTLPLVRGCVALVESLGLGYKALDVAASHAYDKYDMCYSMYLRAGLDPATATEEERIKAAGYSPEEERELLEKLHEGAPSEESGSTEAEGAVAAQDGGQDDFSWQRDFGNPDEMIDALGAQRSLSVVSEDPAQPAPAKAPAKNEEEEAGGLSGAAMGLSMVLGIVLAVVLFMALPIFLADLVFDNETQYVPWTITNGVVRVGIFIAYLWLIGRMKDIKRMFGYHGAEHKSIHCFEHQLDMTPENARSFPRLHVRCGTAFLIMVLILAIIVYAVIPVPKLFEALGVGPGILRSVLVFVVHLVFLPVIAGVSYEVNVKWAGTHPDNPLVKVLLWPGMQMQYLTTNEPDDGQIECAIAAMNLVLERERKEEAKAAAQA